MIRLGYAFRYFCLPAKFTYYSQETYFFNTLLGVDPDRGRMREPVIVDCDKAPTDPCPYMVGPHGHPPGQAVTLVRPFRKGLDAGNGGVVFVYPKSHSQGKIEAKRPEQLKWDEVLIMWGNLSLDKK
jgi:hypothetical protein